MIYVICANNSLVEATNNELKAKKRLKVLQKIGFKEFVAHGNENSFDTYTKRIYWHIHDIKEVG
jgi:hypothetical protein